MLSTLAADFLCGLFSLSNLWTAIVSIDQAYSVSAMKGNLSNMHQVAVISPTTNDRC